MSCWIVFNHKNRGLSPISPPISPLNKKKLAKPVAATGLTAGQMVDHYRRIASLVTARQLTDQVSRDADDDQVLACALAARADLIVSGDDDLLILKAFQGIRIVSPAEAVRIIKLPQEPPRGSL